MSAKSNSLVPITGFASLLTAKRVKNMRIFLSGAFGALLPDIILIWSKRFTAPLLTFNLKQYAIVTLIYIISAGIVAVIYPYRKKPPKPWHAVIIGIIFPTIVASLISMADRIGRPEEMLILRGPNPTISESVKIPGTLIDLMAAF